MTLHDGELAIDEGLVGRLIADRIPAFAGLPVRAVPSTGTVNAIFRLGDDLVARLPRLARWGAALVREVAWLPRLAPRLSLRVPEPVAVGRPTAEYPSVWAIYRWLDGVPYAGPPRPAASRRAASRRAASMRAAVADDVHAAGALARFVRELHAIDPAGGPPAGRAPLRDLDAETRAAIDAARPAIDADAAHAAWTRALAAPVWDGDPAWIHGDLMRPNLLVADGRIRAVLDFGAVGVGDPATDLVAAWSVLGPSGRAVFRASLGDDPRSDAGAWERARGYALHQAALIVPYYAASNPAFAAEGVRIAAEVLGDGAT